MKLTSIRLAAVAILALCAPALAAEEMVENPAYKHWASYKPGTSITFKTVQDVKMKTDPDAPPVAMKNEMTMTQKLVEVTAEKVVVEMSMEMNAQGRSMKMPAQKQNILAKVEKSKVDIGQMPAGFDAKASNVKDGKDTVEVKGDKLATITKEMDMEMKQGTQTMKSHMKTWTSEKVPGGMVKMTTQMKEPMESDMTMTLVDYTVAK